jgi:CRISPR-associated protein Cas1
MDEPGGDRHQTSPEDAEDRLIPARMLNEVVYCPRLFYLEHVAGEWEDSADTIAGKRVHRRVDAKSSPMPEAGELPEGFKGRSVTVASEADGIVAKVDLVEAEAGAVCPVDYKRGSAPKPERIPGGVWPADRVQVGAQAVALRASGYECREAVVYYAQSKTRVVVAVDDGLIQEVRAAVTQARQLREARTPPPPLVDSAKCPGCSLVGICLPDETNALRLAPEWPAGPVKVRRLLPSDDDRHPCHVQAAGATVGKSGELLEVRFRDGTRQEARLAGVSHLSLFGKVHLTTDAVQALCSRDIGVSYFTFGGWFFGTLTSVPSVNVLTRIAQFRVAADAQAALPLARTFVSGKILNCRTLLRRNTRDRSSLALDQLRRHAEEALGAKSTESLLGIEGSAARIYFREFPSMVAAGGDGGGFDFERRSRRPPRDPVNALLSFGYALLLRECHGALLKVGLDPSVGFLHQPRPGRPGLALDLMEEFRPLVADSTVLSALNSGAVQECDFVRAAGGVALGESGRRSFLSAFERRVAQEITHPIFDYRISYRRVLEVQARLLARVLTGELAEYPSFQTR